jgi:hypothetical protein
MPRFISARHGVSIEAFEDMCWALSTHGLYPIHHDLCEVKGLNNLSVAGHVMTLKADALTSKTPKSTSIQRLT